MRSCIASITIVAALICLYTTVRAVEYDPQAIAAAAPQGAAALATLTAPASSTYPSRLIIPSLSINAAVQDVGITARGNVGIPSNFTDVAWYKYSAVPGQAGAALIDGHVDNGLGLAGVFKHLDTITDGANIEIVEQNGTALNFLVTSVHAYNYHDVPMSTLLASSSTETAPILYLITCTGGWVPGQDTYNERLVITAALVHPS